MVSLSRFACAILVLIVIGGCSYQGRYIQPTVPDGAIMQITVGFRDLPNGSKLYFQNGRHISRGELDRWLPYCELYVFNRDKQADYHTSVLPGQFDVAASRFNREIVNNANPQKFKSIQLASLLWRDDGPPSYILYSTTMNLFSNQQPDVKKLTCSQKASTYGEYHLTLAQIRETLGQLIELRI